MSRDDLIEEVRYGRMTPDEAEAEAARLRIGPLAGKPADGAFDPMGETWWTLAMTVAWIVWRTPESVRTYWDAYRRECWSWRFREWRHGPDGPVQAGHFLEQWPSATLSLLAIAESYHRSQGLLPAGAISAKDAKTKLWQALSERAFEATGIVPDSGERIVIPDYVWRDLTDIEESGRDVLRGRTQGPYVSHGYDDVAFRRQSIVATWQPKRLRGRARELPALVNPDGPGYMPLYLAAQWIATCGGSIEVAPDNLSVWRAAFEQLLARIASDQVAVTGVRDGAREKIDGHTFAAIPVDYPFSDTSIEMILSEELYLSSCVYIDEEHWRKGWNDSLQTRQGCKWSKLMALKSDVARWWTFTSGTPPDEFTSPVRTGAPGRPSSMHLIEAEHTARWDRGDAASAVATESRALHSWFKVTHPNSPAPTPNTIENKIRTEHRRRKVEARN